VLSIVGLAVCVVAAMHVSSRPAPTLTATKPGHVASTPPEIAADAADAGDAGDPADAGDAGDPADAADAAAADASDPNATTPGNDSADSEPEQQRRPIKAAGFWPNARMPTACGNATSPFTRLMCNTSQLST
jgi:hypothetical protein